MKDETHHMEKFIKSFIKEENPKDDNCLKQYRKPTTKKQIKKQAKAKKRKKEETRILDVDTQEERNKKMKKRIPKIRERANKTNI